MSDFDTRARRGAHRAHRHLVAGLLPVLAAVAAVVVVLVAVGFWPGGAGSSDDARVIPDALTTPAVPHGQAGAASTAAVAHASGAASTLAATRRATPAPLSTTSPRSTTSPTRAPSPSLSTPATPRARPSSHPAHAAAPTIRAEVVVLNQTLVHGLAAQVAAQLRRAGWSVAATGNFHGQLPATTVYYPPGMAGAAGAVAAQVGGRVRPRFGNLSVSRVTVVLAGLSG